MRPAQSGRQSFSSLCRQVELGSACICPLSSYLSFSSSSAAYPTYGLCVLRPTGWGLVFLVRCPAVPVQENGEAFKTGLAFSPSVVLVLMCSLPNVNPSIPCKRASKVSRRHVEVVACLNKVLSGVSSLHARLSVRRSPSLFRNIQIT